MKQDIREHFILFIYLFIFAKFECGIIKLKKENHTGNYSQYPVINNNGGNKKRMSIYIYMYN